MVHHNLCTLSTRFHIGVSVSLQWPGCLSPNVCAQRYAPGTPAHKGADRQRHAEQSKLCFVARPAVPLSPRCEQCWRQIPFRLSCLPNDFCFTALLDCVHQDGSLLKCQGTLNCCYPGERPFQSAQALEVAQTPR